MKKAMSLFLSLAMILLLVGCASNGNGSAGTGETTDVPEMRIGIYRFNARWDSSRM